jgi:hypothetical protein
MEAPFISMVDTYIQNYDCYPENEQISFECEYGELIFHKNTKNKNTTHTIILYGIYIHPIYRKQGLCTKILRYLIDRSKGRFTYCMVEAVLSNILYDYLLRFSYQNKKFKNTRYGFVYMIV